MAASDNLTVTFRLRADNAELRPALSNARKEIQDLGAAGNQAGNAASAGMGRAASATQSLGQTASVTRSSLAQMGRQALDTSSQIQTAALSANSALGRIRDTLVHLRSGLAIVFGVSLGAAAIREVAALADGYTNLTSRLRNVTESEDALARVRERSFDIAQRTRTQFDSTVTLYARLTRATETLNTTEAQRLSITETINKAYTLSGATVKEATNSIIQLTQGLAAGALRGEEFNSVAEQGPIILDLLGRSLGKTRGELRAMAKEGELTAAVIVKAILEGQSVIDAQFANVAVTIEGAATRVVNAWQRWLGQTEQTSVAAATIASLFTTIATNIDLIASAALAAAGALTLIFAGRTVRSILEYATSLGQAVQVQAAWSTAIKEDLTRTAAAQVATVELSAAKVAEARATQAQLQATQASLVVEREASIAKLQSLDIEVARATAMLNAAKSAGAMSYALATVAEAEVALTRIEAARTAILGDLASTGILYSRSLTAQVAAAEALTAAEMQLTAAQNAHGAAVGRAAAAQTGLSAALSSVAAGGSRLFAAVGGWTTVVLGLAYAFYEWSTSVQDNTSLLNALNNAIERNKQESLSLADVYRSLVSGETARKQNLEELTRSQLEQAEAEMAAIRANRDYYLSMQEITGSVGLSTVSAGLYAAQLYVAQGRTEELRKKLDELVKTDAEAKFAALANKALEFSRNLGQMLGLLDRAGPVPTESKESKDLSDSLAKQIVRLREQNIQLKEGTLAAMEYKAVMDAGVKSIDDLTEAQRAQIQEAASLSDANKKLQESKRASVREDREQEKAAKNLLEVAAKFREETDSLAAELAGPRAKAVDVYAKHIKDAGEAYSSGAVSLAEFTRREQLARQQLQQTTAEIERQEKALTKELDVLGQFNRELAEDALLVGLSERDAAIETAVLNITRAYEEAALKAEAAGRKMEYSLEEVQASVRSSEAAFYDYKKSIEDWARFAEGISSGVSEAFGKFYADAIFNFDDIDNTFKNLGRSLLDTAKQSVANIIAEFFKLRMLNPLLNSIFGTNLQTGGGGILGSLFGGGAGGNGGFISGLTSAFSGAGGIFSAQNWLTAGKNIWSGFSGAGSGTGFGSLFGFGGASAAAGTGTLAGLMGAGGYSGLVAGGGAWLGSGAAAAGYLGSVGAGGGLGSGAYASLALGGSGAAGTSVATGASTAAMTSSMAIPIIGWIIAGIMANMSLAAQGWTWDETRSTTDTIVDGIFGGFTGTIGNILSDIGVNERWARLGDGITARLFGRRAPRVTGYGMDWEFGQDGTVGGTQSVDWKSKGGLFRSSKYGSEISDLDAQVLREIEEFWEGIVQSTERIIKRFGGEMPDLVEASFRQEFDKEGELEKSIGTILGKTYEEAWEIFQQRIAAENIIAALEASDLGGGLSDLAEQWRGNAAELLDGASMMLQAAEDIRNGVGLLGEKAGLAGAVELIQDLAHSGESLVAAYTRVYQSTLLLEQMVSFTGESLDLGREAFVRFATDVSDAAGGLDNLTSLWQSFAQAFYGAGEIAAQQLDVLREASNRALTGVGLGSGTSMDEFREAFDEAFPRLSPEEIVQWLQAGQALAAVTQAMDSLVNESTSYLESLGLFGFGLSAFQRRIQEITQAGERAEDAANALARAHGREGASALELARIHQWTASQIAAAIRQLEQETRDIIAQLYGGMPGSLGAINEQISQLEGTFGNVADGLRDVANASNQLFEDWQRGQQSLRDYLDQMLLGDLSALSPEMQLAEARRQLEEMAAAAAGGDAGAMADLPRLADVYLRLLREFEASGEDYNSGFAWVRDLLEGILALPNPGTPGNLGQNQGTTTYVAPSPELIALYAERDRLLAEQEGEYRRQLAEQLARNLADLAEATRTPIMQLFELYSVSLRDLATDLGVNLDNITSESVIALGNLASTLGLTLTELTTELGINLTDLATGLTELTGQLGIDLQNLTVESTLALGDLARSLGIDLSELTEALGVDLGDLASSQSLLNQALERAISMLPEDQQALLRPLFEAIVSATDRGNANAAIDALEDAVRGLPPDLQNLLAPFLPGVGMADQLSDLDYLSDIFTVNQDQLTALYRIADNLKASNEYFNIPAYEKGIGYVPNTGPAILHQKEAVFPAPVATWLRDNGFPVVDYTGGDSAVSQAAVGILKDISLRLEEMNTRDAATANEDRLNRAQESDEMRQQTREFVAAVQGSPIFKSSRM